MDNQPEAITTLFDQQAENYQQNYVDGMLAHYAPDAELLFWSSENVKCTTHSAACASGTNHCLSSSRFSRFNTG